MCFEKVYIEHALNLELAELANHCYCDKETGVAHNTWGYIRGKHKQDILDLHTFVSSPEQTMDKMENRGIVWDTGVSLAFWMEFWD